MGLHISRYQLFNHRKHNSKNKCLLISILKSLFENYTFYAKAAKDVRRARLFVNSNISTKDLSYIFNILFGFYFNTRLC